MKKSLIIISFLFLITACVKDTLNITDSGRRITINGLITSDSCFSVKISKSALLNDISESTNNTLYSIDNAKVLVYMNDNYVDSLSYIFLGSGSPFEGPYISRMGNYSSGNMIPIPGNKYKIVVKAPGLPDATAAVTIPNLVKIERVDTFRTIVPLQYPDPYITTNVQLTCNVIFTDPGNEINYYMLNIYYVHEAWGYRHCFILNFFCNDPIPEEKFARWGTFGNDELQAVAFSDKIISGKKCSFPVTIELRDLGFPFYPVPDGTDTHKKNVYFRLYSISEEYYKYLQTLNKYE
ncbi:MAG TPA: DUF4249 family protein, partial [Bacteroidales bacterium]|nr:DUF4249 family protein [Bacteroidales bacterium]